jgi:Zn-dependent membrane protease YugP
MGKITRSGVGLFTATVLFALMTLPIGYNASRRARGVLGHLNLVEADEQAGVDRALNAAVLTYAASAAQALAARLFLPSSSLVTAARRNRLLREQAFVL